MTNPFNPFFPPKTLSDIVKPPLPQPPPTNLTLLELLGKTTPAPKVTKHKVFISYYHKSDEDYKIEFDRLFGDIFINRSVGPGDIDADNSADYIKSLIQDDYISDSSVLIVLVGPKTYCRKHVDWEISAALNKKVGGYSGLLGIRLPTHPAYGRPYDPCLVPPRLYKNIESGFAKFYGWTESQESIRTWVEIAFNSRIADTEKIANSDPQFKSNRCD